MPLLYLLLQQRCGTHRTPLCPPVKSKHLTLTLTLTLTPTPPPIKALLSHERHSYLRVDGSIKVGVTIREQGRWPGVHSLGWTIWDQWSNRNHNPNPDPNPIWYQRDGSINNFHGILILYILGPDKSRNCERTPESQPESKPSPKPNPKPESKHSPCRTLFPNCNRNRNPNSSS